MTGYIQYRTNHQRPEVKDRQVNRISQILSFETNSFQPTKNGRSPGMVWQESLTGLFRTLEPRGEPSCLPRGKHFVILLTNGSNKSKNLSIFKDKYLKIACIGHSYYARVDILKGKYTLNT